jgi:SH3-like domain-containing protein
MRSRAVARAPGSGPARAGRRARWLLAAIALVAPLAAAQDFRSVAEAVAVGHDGPSAKSKRLWLLGRGYPLQVAVSIEGWTKVRDATGALYWVENRALSTSRTVLVRAPVASLRESPSDTAPVVLRVARDVTLDLLEPPQGEWARVRHRDGTSGFVHANQVFGL